MKDIITRSVLIFFSIYLTTYFIDFFLSLIMIVAYSALAIFSFFKSIISNLILEYSINNFIYDFASSIIQIIIGGLIIIYCIICKKFMYIGANFWSTALQESPDSFDSEFKKNKMNLYNVIKLAILKGITFAVIPSYLMGIIIGFLKTSNQ